MQIVEEIKKLGCALYDRLDREVVDDAVSYVDFGENSLALETLCDQIFEYDVPLKQGEFEIIKQLGETLKIDMERVECLKELTKSVL